MQKDNNTFEYSYSASEQEEIRKIRKKYSFQEEKNIDNMERVRLLDKKVTRKGRAWALVLGVIGTLVLGTGMSMVMTDFGGMIAGEYSWICGIMIGVCGLVLLSLAYPVYNHITKKERERIAPEILRLTDELLK